MFKRIQLGEFLFGNSDESNEVNLSYLLLKVISGLPLSLRAKLPANIVLSGGGSMSFGFYRRFVEEIEFCLENVEEFKILSKMKEKINVHKLIYPRNCLSWLAGILIELKFIFLASVLTNYDKLIFDELSIKYDEGNEKIENILKKVKI